MLAYDYPLLGIFWTTLWIFLWIAWFMLLFRVIFDIFRSDDMGGWGKAGWCIFVVFLPFLGVFVYLLSQGHKMADRDVEHMQAARAQQDAHIKSVAGSSPADQIIQAKQLLDSGAITQAEFDTMKAKALA